MPKDQPTVTGYRGEISDVQLLPQGEASLSPGPDLVDMAERALGYLARNPDPAHDYQCRFSWFLLNCPPFTPLCTPEQGNIDPIAIGDTESRNDMAFNMMREMTGSDLGHEADEAVHRRLVGYVHGANDEIPRAPSASASLGMTGSGAAGNDSGEPGDDMCWVVPYCGSPDVDAEFAMPWTTALLLLSETDRFRRDGDRGHGTLARRLFEGLQRIAAWDTGRAYYPNAGQAFRPGRLARGYEGHYPTVIGAIAQYGTAFGDAEALAFADAMAEGFLADLQPGHWHQPDGSVHGHNHVQMHAVRDVARMGYMTGNGRYLAWAKAAYDFYHRNGFETGWLPEHIFEPDHRNHSETCLTGDMTEIEVWLALSGRPRYWDRVDRTIRNYLAPAQFTLTPEIEAFWRQANTQRTPEEIAANLALLRELEGGFLSALTPNDRVFEVHRGGVHHGSVNFEGRDLVFDMMGCCPPEGMRALHLAWANVVTQAAEGVRVNLAFDHDGPLASVASGLPGAGRVQVTPKVAADFQVRPPSWAPRGEVRAFRDGREIAAKWGGPAFDYIMFPQAQPGEALEIRFPLVRFRQQVSERNWDDSSPEAPPGLTYEYEWTGSLVTGVAPQGEWLPLYG